MAELIPIAYQTPVPRSSRAALAVFIASIVAFFMFFLILPPVITLVLSLTMRGSLQKNGDEIGLSRAGAAFATSVVGTLFAVIVAGGLLVGSVRVF